jgi:hypothetical protein
MDSNKDNKVQEEQNEDKDILKKSEDQAETKDYNEQTLLDFLRRVQEAAEEDDQVDESVVSQIKIWKKELEKTKEDK